MALSVEYVVDRDVVCLSVPKCQCNGFGVELASSRIKGKKRRTRKVFSELRR